MPRRRDRDFVSGNYTPADVYEYDVGLSSGEEWHSKPFTLRDDDDVTISCRGNANFYAGIFDREEYFELRGSEGGAFGFEFGTDAQGFTDRFVVDGDDDYYVVVRVGVFTPGPVLVNVRLRIERE